MADKNIRINNQIRVKEVRLIDAEGKQYGIIETQEAIKMAMAANLDLVEIAPNAELPVCRIMDFGKYKYEQEKRQRENKKNASTVKLKEIRMQPKIEKHDLAFKTKHIKEFLDENSKVKVTIRFRGRELAHTDRGKVVLDKILESLTEQDIPYNVEKPPIMEGKTMSMMLGPKQKK